MAAEGGMGSARESIEKNINAAREIVSNLQSLHYDRKQRKKCFASLEMTLNNLHRAWKLEDLRIEFERAAEREAMKEDLIARQGHVELVLERHRVLGEQDKDSDLLFDRAISSANAIQAAIDEMRPNRLPEGSKDIYNMLNTVGMDMVK